jgi:succinyl-diaminopimelate desuccinylase
MLKAYRTETGDEESTAIVQPGGTYAKMVHNILCYGALFPGEEDTMHQANEKLSIESYMKMARIYARAIHALCCE